MRLAQSALLALGLSAVAIAQERQNLPYASGYFGEPIYGLSPEQRASFDRGYLLFVKEWPARDGASRNAASCVACHSAPMPGGSGMSHQALVAVTSSESGTEILSKDSPPQHSTERRRTPALFGVGLLEFAESRIERSGKAKPIFGAVQDTSSLEEFVAKAFFAELGLGSRAFCSSQATTLAIGCRADITDFELADVVTYIRFLAPPPRHGTTDAVGRSVFFSSGCGACHTETVATIVDAPAPIAGFVFSAFTDLERHNLGKMSVRTMPLWGVNSVGPPYMHDGSADSLEDAIIAHGGAGSNSRDLYLSLTRDQRDRLLEFLKSL